MDASHSSQYQTSSSARRVELVRTTAALAAVHVAVAAPPEASVAGPEAAPGCELGSVSPPLPIPVPALALARSGSREARNASAGASG